MSDGEGGRRDFWSSKCHVGGPGNALKAGIEGTSGRIGGLTRHIKGLSGYATGRYGNVLPLVSKLVVIDV